MMDPSGPSNLKESVDFLGFYLTGATGLEPATSGVTGRRSNQLSYAPAWVARVAADRSPARVLSMPSRIVVVPRPRGQCDGRFKLASQPVLV
jgi:hypothetical protein